jgi:SPP1 gp7 family putative phage head morphogenesis protein
MPFAWEATAEPERFDEAVEWFRDRFPVTPDLLAKLGGYAGKRAWTVAGVAQLDVVLDTYDSLRKAIEDGTPYEEWKKGIEDKLTAAWGKPDAYRVETIFRNATSQSLNAGRYRQMHDPEVKKLRPYVLIDGVDDARQSDICERIDGTVVPIDSPWLDTHSPQLHHRCRTQVVSLTEEAAKARGITDEPSTLKAGDGFGAPPTDDAVPFKPDPAKYPAELFEAYEEKNTATEGIHFAKLTSNAPAAKQQLVLDALADYGLLPFLERQPLEKLDIANTIKRANVAGLYNETRKTLTVRVKAWTGRTWGVPFEAGKSRTWAASASDWDEQVRRTVLHEMGHHIHLSSAQVSGLRSTVTNFYRRAVKSGLFITKYAAVDEAEYFAECFSVYWEAGTFLQEYDPDGYRMVEQVLTMQGFI